ncbi:MAG: hypothetical protein LBB61_06435 [Treponema sp.]|nr:hypothetical protein [Treponema sp.]
MRIFRFFIAYNTAHPLPRRAAAVQGCGAAGVFGVLGQKCARPRSVSGSMLQPCRLA